MTVGIIPRPKNGPFSAGESFPFVGLYRFVGGLRVGVLGCEKLDRGVSAAKTTIERV